MNFFNLDNLPENQHDPDLIEIHKKKIIPQSLKKRNNLWNQKF